MWDGAFTRQSIRNHEKSLKGPKHRDVIFIMVYMNGTVYMAVGVGLGHKVGWGALPGAKEDVAVGKTVSREDS